jgi:hypothetical protein
MDRVQEESPVQTLTMDLLDSYPILWRLYTSRTSFHSIEKSGAINSCWSMDFGLWVMVLWLDSILTLNDERGGL